MADWTNTRLNLRYHWKTVLVWLLVLGVLVAVLAAPPAAGQTTPRIEEIAFADGGRLRTYILGDTIAVTVTFSEAVAVTGTPQIALTIGSTTRHADYQSGSSSETLVFHYTVTDTDEDTDGVGIAANALTLNGGSITKHNADSDADLTHEATGLWSLTVDGIAPVLRTAAVYGAQLVLIYSETIWDSNPPPAKSDWAVSVNGVARAVTGVTIRGRTVTLTLASAVAAGDGVTVSYTVGTQPVRDAPAGNSVAALSNRAVTTTAPSVSSLAITSTPAARQTYAGGEEIEITVTFSERVTVTGTPELLLTFDSNGPYEQAAQYVSGSGTTTLVFRYTVSEGLRRFIATVIRWTGRDAPIGDEAPDGLSIAAGALGLNDGTIRDSDNHDAWLRLDALTNDGDHKVDGRWPDTVLDGIVANGATLTVRFDEMLDDNSVPPSTAFAVTVNGASNAVTGVSIADSTVTLTLRTPVRTSDGIGVRYTQPTGVGATPLRDTVGNKAQSFFSPPVVVVSFGAGRYTATEGGPATAVTVTLDRDPERTVKIWLTTTNRGGATDDDYTGVPSSVTFTSGGPTSQTFHVTAADDSVDDAGESVQIELDPLISYRVEVGSPATAVVTLAEPGRSPPPPPDDTSSGTGSTGGTGGTGGGGGGGGGGTRTPTDRHGDTPEDATSLNPRRYTTGVISRTITAHLQSRRDVDYFTLDLPYAGILTASTTGTDTTGRLYQAQDEGNPRLVTEDTDSGRGSNFALGTAVEAGTCYLAVLAGRGSGEYRLSVHYTPAFAGNPGPNSPQSGVSVLSGWVCEADTVEIEFETPGAAVQTLEAATGTSRPDTASHCGPRTTDTGYGLLFNWNRLGDGEHTVRVLIDDVVLAERQITVTTLGEHPEQEFRRGLSHTTDIPDFPDMGETTTLRWQTARQNFMIASGAGGGGGQQLTPEQAWLGNPAPHSFQSGVGVLSGWVCEADTVTLAIETAAGTTITEAAGYGTERLDTAGKCGDTDNGFGVLFNWNRLGDGQHTVRALADGEEFAHSTFTVTTLGEAFAEDLARTHDIEDFPAEGQTTTVEWQAGQQNFVITGVE